MPFVIELDSLRNRSSADVESALRGGYAGEGAEGLALAEAGLVAPTDARARARTVRPRARGALARAPDAARTPAHAARAAPLAAAAAALARADDDAPLGAVAGAPLDGKHVVVVYVDRNPLLARILKNLRISLSQVPQAVGGGREPRRHVRAHGAGPVSYTHLTLPTILLV